ncbi:MAG: GNAT family N-acetyltransferase [Saprospiraceae bacterium]|nr:GNAT family N-acetyltransferase [Saprospiraceae bacterium]
MITTERLYLIPSTLPLLDAIVEDRHDELSSLLGGADIAPGWSHFPEAMVWMRDFISEYPEQAEWWNYLIILRDEVRLVGACGFKGPPVLQPEVEIGYEIAPGWQNRGLATEAARALCDWAFQSPDIESVTAHTLAEENPSVKLLRRLGFDFEGELVDLEDGLIWAWRKGK